MMLLLSFSGHIVLVCEVHGCIIYINLKFITKLFMHRRKIQNYNSLIILASLIAKTYCIGEPAQVWSSMCTLTVFEPQSMEQDEG